MELSLAERRLLAALAQRGPCPASSLVGDLFRSEADVLQASSGPERHGWVQVTQDAETLHALSAEGARIHAIGLPEWRAALWLKEHGSAPAGELAAGALLSDAEARILIGLLKRNGWATLEKGESGPRIVGAALPPSYPLADLFRSLSAQPRALAPSPELASLVERGLVAATQRRTRHLALTAAGAQVAAGLPPVAAGTTEVTQMTPELVAQWPTLTPAQRAATHLRPFDFDVAVTVPSAGKPHPLSAILAEIRAIFWSMGFTEIAGDYVESAHWNMDALFIPQDHPARDMQDTFYLANPAELPVASADLDRSAAIHERGGGTGSTGWGGRFDPAVSRKALLRTHTTNTTVRYLAAHPQGPCKVFGLGRVFRKETMDATHLPEFTQIEGIATEPGATFDTLVGLCRHFFARMGFPQVRFRPAYFPYTEPSMEIDVFYNNRWMELGGCGIFRPEVTAPLGVPHNVLAWGFGLERLAMMRLGLQDIRDLYISDIQWLRETPLR